MPGVAAEVAASMSPSQQQKSRQQQPAAAARRRRAERTMSYSELVYKFAMLQGGINKKMDCLQLKIFLFFLLFVLL